MKRTIIPTLLVGAVFALSSCATKNIAQPASVPSGDPAAFAGQETTGNPYMTNDWPLVLPQDNTDYTVFQPQCDSWNGHDFTGRSAVAVQAAGQPATYGVIGFQAITLVDKDTRTVKLADVQITSADFPTARGMTKSYLAALRATFPGRAAALSLDLVEGSLTFTQPQPAQRLINTPPKVVIATRPAVLVSIDGPPAWRPVPGTSLERAINTRVLLLKDTSGQYYLHLFDGYLQADSLNGHWRVAAPIPDGASLAMEEAITAGNVDLLQGTPDVVTHKEPSLSSSVIPDVFVATTPSELLTFSGPPEYASIPGTDLLYADNTSANVFKLLTDQQNYILISGRWYRAASLNGPWQFVPGDKLPSDFMNIPDTSPKENVKASVPGTEQAEEALIANSIPQSAAISRAEPMQNPQMDGLPQLAPIQGTPLDYVVNSATPIIEVGPQQWYACQDGTWFFSTSVNGPWSVAASVPAVIYTIPTSSPLHYVTYVQVYGSTPDLVYEGYTPGYLGTEVADDGTVVYGTGYDYEPWIGSDWIGPPVTWGCGFDECWTPWWGWGYDCGFGWGCGFPGFGWWGCCPPFPWWGGYRCFGFHDHDFGHNGFFRADRDDFSNTDANFYHHGGIGMTGQRQQFAQSGFGPIGRRSGSAWAGAFGRAYNSRTGRLAEGQQARVQNVFGSAWNHPNFAENNRPAFSDNRPAFESGFANHSFPGVAQPMTPAPRVWSGPSYSFPGRSVYTPRYGGIFGNDYRMFQNYGGVRSGGSFGAPRSGGWFHGGIRNIFHGGGGLFHGGGGGGGFHGGGGGGFGGGFAGGGHGGR